MAELLEAATPIPIAQLTPDLSDPSTKCFRAIVTLIWPYSSSNSTLKVLLAEPDFRLRRSKGQVRVQFSGSSARFVSETGIGSGDEVFLSLDGVGWIKDESAGQTPGRSIDWELKFSERLVLKIQQNESDKISVINIDHPIQVSQPEVVQDIPEPEPLPSPPKSTASKASRPELIRSETNEWSSPAFVKRARVSYGSLFESGYDIFAEEDGTIQGKGRKRTRFSRKSGAWRYSSRSQSPQIPQTDEDMVDSGFLEPNEEEKPAMTDEACQTLGLEDDNASEALADLSRQQVTPMYDSIVAEDRPGIYDISVSEPVKVLGRSEVSADMSPPAINHIALQDANQEGGAKMQPPTNSIERTPDTAQMDMGPLDILHPLGQSTPISIGETHPSGLVETEDLYGLSPTADDYPRDATYEANVGHNMSNHDDAQLRSVDALYEHAHLIEDSSTTIAYQKHPSPSTSPEKSFASTLQVYPEPDQAVNDDFTAHSGPYYGKQLQSDPDIDGDHLFQTSEVGWNAQPEDTQSPNTLPLAEHAVSHDGPMHKLLVRHLSPGSVAMSRSQSGHSEMIDLTEESNDEGDGLLEGSHTGKEEEIIDEFFGKGTFEDQSGDEDEDYRNPISEEDAFESVENEFEPDDEDDIRRPRDFHQMKYLAPGEVADDDEDEEEEFQGYGLEEEEFEEEMEEEFDEEEMEEGSYDYDGASDGEDSSTAIKQPLGGEPEVIDLLSSDEEDREDNSVGRDPSEPDETAVARLNETNSMFVEEDESNLEAEHDVENSEGIMEDGYAIGHLLPKTRSAKLPTTKGSERLVEESASEEECEGEGINEIENHDKILAIPLNAVDASGSFQDIQLSTKKQVSTTQSQLDGYGGHDGTSDSPDRPLVAPQEVNRVGRTAGINSDEVTRSGDVTYPVLPTVGEEQPLHREKGIQHEDSLVMLKNDQLPTPDATQLSTVMVPDTSFELAGSIQQSLDSMDFPKHIVSDTQDSLQQEPMDGVTEVAIQASTNGSVANTHEDGARDAFVGDTTVDIKKSLGADVAMETKDTDGEATVEVRTDTANEIRTEKALNVTSNVTADMVRASMIEATQPTPVTPRRSKRLSFSQQRREMLEKALPINVDEPTTPDNYDASVELAMAALDSPSKQDPVELQLSDKQLRVKLSRPLRTNLGNFTTLKLIRFNLEKKLDVLAIVTTHPNEPQRAKSGLRHYHLRFNITDATIGPSSVLSANIFRPYKTALPTVLPGEAVLLRNFVVKSEKAAGFMLRSDEGSSWVVFKHGGEEEIKGPPVEYGEEERDHVTYLKAWYRNLELNAREKLEKANVDKGSDIGRITAKVF